MRVKLEDVEEEEFFVLLDNSGITLYRKKFGNKLETWISTGKLRKIKYILSGVVTQLSELRPQYVVTIPPGMTSLNYSHTSCRFTQSLIKHYLNHSPDLDVDVADYLRSIDNNEKDSSCSEQKPTKSSEQSAVSKSRCTQKTCPNEKEKSAASCNNIKSLSIAPSAKKTCEPTALKASKAPPQTELKLKSRPSGCSETLPSETSSSSSSQKLTAPATPDAAVTPSSHKASKSAEPSSNQSIEETFIIYMKDKTLTLGKVYTQTNTNKFER